jgi:hypothetical protein
MFDTPPPAPILPRKVPVRNILELEPIELARQITLRDRDNFSRILSSEFLGSAWTSKQKLERAPNILQMISDFNLVGIGTEMCDQSMVRALFTLTTMAMCLTRSWEHISVHRSCRPMMSKLGRRSSVLGYWLQRYVCTVRADWHATGLSTDRQRVAPRRS